MSQTQSQIIIDEFHKLYYNGRDNSAKTFEQTTWLGVSCLKCPLDLWIYQEIIYDLKPDLIIETGTYHGGSALYLASICDAVGTGHIATIDIMDIERPAHDRVSYLLGSSTDPDIIQKALSSVPNPNVILVILDSDHSKAHVSEELRLYAPIVTNESYLIVEDTNINGNPVGLSLGEGPYEAVSDFLNDNNAFIPDYLKEKLLLTFNPRGFLKKTLSASNTTQVTMGQKVDEKTNTLTSAIESAHKVELEQYRSEFKIMNESLGDIRKRSSNHALRASKAENQLELITTKLQNTTAKFQKKVTELRESAKLIGEKSTELEYINSLFLVKLALWLQKLASRIKNSLLPLTR